MKSRVKIGAIVSVIGIMILFINCEWYFRNSDDPGVIQTPGISGGGSPGDSGGGSSGGSNPLKPPSGGGAPSSEGTGSVAIQFWTNDTATLATNPGSATLSRGAGDTATITAADGDWTDYTWTLNGPDIIGLEENAPTYTFNSTSRSDGTYTIGLRVKKDDAWYSTTVTVTVTE
jgi:hypothetical protein